MNLVTERKKVVGMLDLFNPPTICRTVGGCGILYRVHSGVPRKLVLVKVYPSQEAVTGVSIGRQRVLL